MLFCSDRTIYVGVTNDLDRRVWEHNEGLLDGCYTHDRRPVELIYAQSFERIEDAIDWEKRVKKWSRPKKLALARGDWQGVRLMARCSNATSTYRRG